MRSTHHAHVQKMIQHSLLKGKMLVQLGERSITQLLIIVEDRKIIYMDNSMYKNLAMFRSCSGPSAVKCKDRRHHLYPSALSMFA
jgi:hypothetical protein